MLSEDQTFAWNSFKQGKNLCITGPAGSGKSFLIQKFIEDAKGKGIAITAATGLAASLIGGTTCHYWAGIGLGLGDVKQLIKKIKRSKAQENWRRTHTLIIDEISMIPATLFDKLDVIGQAIRGSKLPFGGIQLILVGDFLQLPPITKDHQIFCFESEAWKKADIQTIFLRKIFRQNDDKFVEALGEIRKAAVLSQETKDLLVRCSENKLETQDGIVPTRLFCKRVDVADFNKKELAKLPEQPSQKYKSKDFGPDALIDKFRYPSEIELRVGAQVLHLRNDRLRDLVNGSRGIVLYFDETGLPVVRFENKSVLKIAREEETIEEHERVIASRRQLPLCLAWCFTIHRCQGMTLQRVVVDLTGTFECGQAYVALSRVQSADGLQIIGLKPEMIRAHDSAIMFYSKEK